MSAANNDEVYELVMSIASAMSRSTRSQRRGVDSMRATERPLGRNRDSLAWAATVSPTLSTSGHDAIGEARYPRLN